MATIKSTVEMCQNQDTMEQQESELLELTSGTMSESKESMEEQENSVEEPTVILAVRIDVVLFRVPIAKVPCLDTFSNSHHPSLDQFRS